MRTPFKFGAALVANERYFLAGRPSESPREDVDRDSGKGTGGGKGRTGGAGGV